MKKVFIDKSFFNLENPLSEGILSGLKIITEKNYELFSNINFNEIDRSLKKILELENIEIRSKQISGDEFYIITSGKGNDKDNYLVVERNSEINSFLKAAEKLVFVSRKADLIRETKETKIAIEVNLDSEGRAEVKTGLGFFDHMLEQIARHSNIDLKVNCEGDLDVDEHHTVEDVALALGEVILKALGNKKGISRYGFFLPMDDSEASCTIDLSGRPYLKYKVKHDRERVGDFPTELTEEFFKSISIGLNANVHIKAKGKNEHHKIEAIFKSFAKSLNEALKIDPRNRAVLPTTKGVL